MYLRKSSSPVGFETELVPKEQSRHTFPEVDSLSWKDLSVAVNGRQATAPKTILSESSGIARPGEMMALMGPSGSGKTTLLNALAQRPVGSVSGQVFINGKERSLAIHRAMCAYVEQEDTLIGSLTVAETLQFVAELTISRSHSKSTIQARIRSLIEDFGLIHQTNVLIGTPFRKGISGGQKRRVSVAAQLIAGPSVLYLDEPTSGLDSTASYEVMSCIKSIAKQRNLIVIASIHQPSTKTFDLFDQVTLLSRGRTCFTGRRVEMPDYFAELDLEIPPMMNPAEYLLDLVNVDFTAGQQGQERLEKITSSWNRSVVQQQLIASVAKLKQVSPPLQASIKAAERPGMVKQTWVLLHRAWIKSYHDIVTYWVRIVMYLGLAVMMGTVWLRLETDQQHIQAFVNAIFFGSAFMSFMAVAYVPAYLEDRAMYVKERANGLYGPTVFMLSNFIIGLPYLFLISMLFSIIAYWLGNFNPTGKHFFVWILWLFLDLIAAEGLVVCVASLVPNFVGALAITAFANGLWMSVGGFLVPLPLLNVFWKYVFHYWDYQSYVFQGMMVNEFKTRTYRCAQLGSSCHCMYPSALQDQCQIAGAAVLQQYGYALNKQGEWLGVMVAIIFGYRFVAWAINWIKKQ